MAGVGAAVKGVSFGVKGVGTALNALGTTRAVGQQVNDAAGPSTVQQAKKGALLTMATFYGFTPANPILMPFQIVLMIILIIILMYNGLGFGYSALGAYLIQGILFTYINYKYLSFGSTFIFGI